MKVWNCKVHIPSWPIFIAKACRGEYMLKNSLNLQFFTPCSLQAVIEEDLEDKKIKGFGSRVKNPCTQRYTVSVAVALGHFMKMHLAHRLLRCIFGSGEGTLYINVLFSLFSILQPPNISLLHGLLMCTAFCTQIHAVPYVTISKQI